MHLGRKRGLGSIVEKRLGSCFMSPNHSMFTPCAYLLDGKSSELLQRSSKFAGDVSQVTEVVK